MNDSPGALTVPEVLAVREGSLIGRAPAGKEHVLQTDAISVWTKGSPAYRLDKVFEVTAPIATFVPRGTVRQELRRPPIAGCFVMFNGYGLIRKAAGAKGVGVVALGAQKLTVPYVKEISPSAATRLKELILTIESIPEADVLGKLRRTSLLLEAARTYCETKARGADQCTHREAARLRRLIEDHAYEDIGMSEIYRKIRLSRSHAQMLFAKSFGTTSVAYRRRLRMQRARELLLSTQMTVREVSKAVGYADPFYFSRLFRRTFGVAPSRLIYEFGETHE